MLPKIATTVQILESGFYVLRLKANRNLTMACSLPLYFLTWLFVCKSGSGAGVFILNCNNLYRRHKIEISTFKYKPSFVAFAFPVGNPQHLTIYQSPTVL